MVKKVFWAKYECLKNFDRAYAVRVLGFKSKGGVVKLFECAALDYDLGEVHKIETRYVIAESEDEAKKKFAKFIIKNKIEYENICCIEVDSEKYIF